MGEHADDEIDRSYSEQCEEDMENALSNEINKLKKELEELKVKSEQLEGTCQNTFERWQNAMHRETILDENLKAAHQRIDKMGGDLISAYLRLSKALTLLKVAGPNPLLIKEDEYWEKFHELFPQEEEEE